MLKRALIILSLIYSIASVSANETNNLQTSFLNGTANICAINIRTFNAKDTNGNEIIDENEISGNFINAIERLDEIKEMGINTLHLLPITPVGKLKALGTAGSLYAISDFSSINPQLVDYSSDLSPIEQAKLFINECHKRGISVIIDLPSCGSYDLFLKHPELFIKDNKQCSIVPSDWTDVRLFNTGENGKLNQDNLDIHKQFIDFVLELGADGIRADVATIKPYDFWVEIIKYAREKDAEFLFLAEASDSWREPPSELAEFTPYDKLLEAGFDGYYGSFFNLKEWTANDFIEHIKFNKKLLAQNHKNVILSFTTHDEVSPIILHGEKFSIMISWLEATLPFNPYCIDGFYTGDTYIYPWENSKATLTDTDDDFYFVHRGKLDIFNFSRKPDGKNEIIKQNYKEALSFRKNYENLIVNGDFNALKTNDDKVFAYSRTLDKETLIVVGNLDFEQERNKITIKLPKLKRKSYEIIHKSAGMKVGNKKIIFNLKPGDITIIKMKEG